MNAKAVIFDMDGVLLDSETLVLSCWEQIAQKHSIADINDVCKQSMGINAKATKEIFLNHFGQDFPYDVYKLEVSELFHQYVKEEKLVLMPGVVELLTYLKKNKVKIGLASSTREKVVKEQLTQVGILSFFDTVICGDMVTNSKPDPEIFLTACEKLEILPTEAYGIEDSYNGIRASYAAGMKTIMVPDQLPPTEEMRELSTIILDSLMDVLNYFIQKQS